MISVASYNAVADWNKDKADNERKKLKREKNYDTRISLQRDISRHLANETYCRVKADIVRRYGGRRFS